MSERATHEEGKAGKVWHKVKEKVPGTLEHAETHPAYIAPDPVYGHTSAQPFGAAARLEAAYHGAMSHVPGSKEHEAKTGLVLPDLTSEPVQAHEPTAVDGRHGPAHAVQHPASGHVHVHHTALGAALDQAWQDIKAATPGTKAHEATHPPGEGPIVELP